MYYQKKYFEFFFSVFSAQSSNNGSNFNRPRPRHTNKGGTAGMPPVSSSLPASAVTAAPYIPTSFQSGGGAADYLPPHHHHHHITYATYEAPPPPMGKKNICTNNLLILYN